MSEYHLKGRNRFKRHYNALFLTCDIRKNPLVEHENVKNRKNCAIRPVFSDTESADHLGLRLSTKPAPVGILYILKTGSYEKLSHNSSKRELRIGAVNKFRIQTFLTGFERGLFTRIFYLFLWNWTYLTGACVKEIRTDQDAATGCYAGTSPEKRQGHDAYLQED